MRRVIGVACFFAAACGATVQQRSVLHVETPAVDPLTASCDRLTHGALPRRDEIAHESSAIVIAAAGEHTLAYVADADSRSIHTVDIDARELGHTRLSGAPRSLMVLADGRVVVTLTDAGRIAVLEPSSDPATPMTTLCERAVADEPWGMARSADDTKLAVTSAWGATLTVLDASLSTKHVVALSRDPRGVVIDEANVAFVSHSVGSKLTVIDLARDETPTSIVDLSVRKSTSLARKEDMRVMRTGSQGFALAKVNEHRILAPMVSVDPGDVVRTSATYYGPPFDGVPKQAPIMSVVDVDRKALLGQALLGTTAKIYRRECLLPRAAAVRSDTSTVFVACNGIDAVLELDALAVDPFRAEKRRVSVAPDPEGLAIDARGKRVIAFSQIGASLAVIPFGEGEPRVIALEYRPDPELAAVTRGRQLFARTDDEHIADDGLACASCHIDARDDGITWTTPKGPRQTPMLAGRLVGTAPYGWEGDRATLVDYIGHTVSNLGGSGMPKADADDLAKFLVATRGPKTRRGDDAIVRRGEEIFSDASQGCSTCHIATATDALRHEFGRDAHDALTSVDTPALQFISGTAPYFHDGRYRSLEAMIADPASPMGHTALLSGLDQAALAAYLRGL